MHLYHRLLFLRKGGTDNKEFNPLLALLSSFYCSPVPTIGGGGGERGEKVRVAFHSHPELDPVGLPG